MLDIRQVTVGHHIIPLRKWHSMVNAIDPTKVKIFGWITVKALPFELWCDLSFGRIGDICGGLQEIDRKTKNMSTLCFARIRMKEQRIGSIPHVIFFKNSIGWYLVQLTRVYSRSKDLNTSGTPQRRWKSGWLQKNEFSSPQQRVS